MPVQLVCFTDTKLVSASSVEVPGTPPSYWLDPIPRGSERQLQEMFLAYEMNPLRDEILSLIDPSGWPYLRTEITIIEALWSGNVSANEMARMILSYPKKCSLLVVYGGIII